MTRQKNEAEDTIRRKESEISGLQAAVEAEQNNVTKCQRQIKDLQQKNKDTEDELDNERNQKQRLEKLRNELEAQIAAYEDQIEEAGGANSAAVSFYNYFTLNMSSEPRDCWILNTVSSLMNLCTWIISEDAIRLS
jgi:chromosome segregation ATPase